MTGMRRPVPPDPPPIEGVRRSRVAARGVDFHVTQAGDGTPVLTLHGWPSHHYCYRDLLADPPEGLRIVAPDLPGYGWSGPAPHRWFKEEVTSDVLALMDALGLERVVLVGHDWGAWIGYLLVLRAPERFSAYLSLGIPHPWNPPSRVLSQAWRLGHMPLNAAAGRALCERTSYIEQLIYRLGTADHSAFTPQEIRWFADRFRDPVCAQVTTDTYRTFVVHEIPATARRPETRRATVPIRALAGKADFAIHPSLVAAETANADDYTVEILPGCGHFIAEERAWLVRDRLITLSREHPA
jgi:pimeloyl-ACP methyl ester carboxylesterase